MAFFQCKLKCLSHEQIFRLTEITFPSFAHSGKQLIVKSIDIGKNVNDIYFNNWRYVQESRYKIYISESGTKCFRGKVEQMCTGIVCLPKRGTICLLRKNVAWPRNWRVCEACRYCFLICHKNSMSTRLGKMLFPSYLIVTIFCPGWYEPYDRLTDWLCFCVALFAIFYTFWS